MKQIDIEVEGVVGVAELLESNAPRTVAAFWDSLPISATLSHVKWSGRACRFEVPEKALAKASEQEHPVCSIYPGTLATRSDHGEVLLSYGPSEYRSDLGVEYVTRIGRLVENQDAIRKVLAGMHSDGDKQIVVRRRSG